ncbi:MAG: PIG-L family deacetylase [Pseudonocardia sp.]
MGTIVSFQAHPDDESITTAATLASAAAAGHRVVLVFATRGELGVPVPGVLEPGEQLAMRRSAECFESAAALGAKRVEFLGYTDSGMMGEASNAAPFCFWQADVEHAARRLALILDEERADVLTTYDDGGGYGHPDHIQVHRVGRRAAALAGVPVVAQSTFPREAVLRRFARMAAEGGAPPPAIDVSTFGKPEAEVTHRVVAGEHAAAKRASLRAHRSQVGPDHFMLALSDDDFAATMGTEHYIVDPLPAQAPELFTELFAPYR